MPKSGDLAHYFNLTSCQKCISDLEFPAFFLSFWFLSFLLIKDLDCCQLSV